MNILAFLLIVLFPAIIYLITVSYFLRQGEKSKTNYDNLIKARDYWEKQYYDANSIVAKLYGRIETHEAKITQLSETLSQSQAHNKDLAEAAKQTLIKAPKFQIVANTQKHPAANDNYLYIEGTIKGQREAGLLRLKQWDEAKATLLKNPEDKPQ